MDYNKKEIYLCYYVISEYQSELSKVKKNIEDINILYSNDKITINEFILECSHKIQNKNATVIFFYAGHSFSYYLRNGNKFVPLSELRVALEQLQPVMCVFDSCAMSTLECLYELKGCTQYILSCEGYGSDYGFLTKYTLSHLKEYAKTNDLVQLGKQMLNDAYQQNKTYHKPWNGSFCNTQNVSLVAHYLSNPNLKHIPYVCDNFPLVDLAKWFRVDISSIVIDFKQNRKDSPNCSGISFVLWVNRKRDLEWYASCQLYIDFKWVRGVHFICDYDKRVLEIDPYILKQIEHSYLSKIKEESEVDEIVDTSNIQKNSETIYQNRYDDLENNISGLIKHYRLKLN
jgi:hypothetical protein